MKFTDIKTIKQYVLENTTEEAIFAYYLDVSVSDIIDSIQHKCKIRNKHRFEANPSVVFNNRHKLKMVDYGSRIWSGDCFHIVGVILGKNCNEGKDFMYILQHIIDNVIKSNTNYIPIDVPMSEEKKELTQIDILVRDFNNSDYAYFNKFNIRKESLVNMFPLKGYWINNQPCYYKYVSSDPCYCYYLGKIQDTILWKLYFPLRKTNRFITNNRISIENITELKGNRFLIITKSQKDKILLKQIFKDLRITTVDICCTLSESVLIPDNIINYLKSKYNKLFSAFDNDNAGNEATNYLASKNIYPIFLVGCLPMAYSKDISDTSRDYGYNHILTMIEEIYNKIIIL